MKKIVLKFGVLSGLTVAVPMVVMLALGRLEEGGLIYGYSMMVLAFLFVFFGIRSYRETVGDGAVTFGKAFQVGLLITLITCAFYVVTWEIYFFGFDQNFAATYAAATIEKLRASGATAAAIAAEQKKMDDFQRLYANPLYNVGMTLMEILPVGLIMTLVSAGILRRKTPREGSAGVVATSVG